VSTTAAAARGVTLDVLRERAPHPLHGSDRVYRETNCYTDIVVELLHACGHEPLAALGTTLAVDFEGDQWTFFKPEPADLRRLFGVEIHEMQPYRPLDLQLAEQLAAGRTIIVELDAWHLPDTAGTSYRAAHVKTSVAVAGIDPAARRLDYFHNIGRHVLEGEDFDRALRVGGAAHPDVLPPYAELVRFDAGAALEGDALRAAARELLGEHLGRRPADNPVARFAARLADDLPDLVEGDLETYHEHAFATARMAGAAFELAASHVRWTLGPAGEPAAGCLDELVRGSKLLSLRLARRRVFDVGALLEPLALAWEDAMASLDRVV
jgi:hypothetical protein